MSRRAVVVGAAFAVAALVLAASVFLGPPAGTDEGPAPDGEGAGAAMPSGVPSEGGGPPGASARDWQYQTIESVGDDKTRITLFSAASASTRGQGVTYMVRPRFRIITTEYADRQTGVDAQGQPVIERVAVGGQAMLLSADTAEMEMEGNKPQRGVFQGAVVVTLLKADGQAVVIDPDDPRFGENTDIQEVFIDGDTRFGLDTNDIRSDAPVHVTSPQADFYGVGLVLKYNTARERIEQLVVSEGRYLMFNPDAESGGGVLAQGGGGEDTETGPAEGSTDAQPADGETQADGDPPAGPSQYYLATFHDNVIVRDTDRALLEGDTLDIRFSLGREAVEPEPVRPIEDAGNTTGLAPLAEAIPGMRLAQANEALPPLPAPFDPALIPQQNRDRSRYTAAPHKGVLITWTGPLRLSPLDEKPEQLADDRDLDIALRGDNAYAQGMRDGKVHRVEGTDLRYLVSTERVVAAGTDDRPVTILSTEAGTLTAAGELVVNIQNGTATIVGPGTLTQNPDEDGKQLTLAWTDRVDLDLYIVRPGADEIQDANERSTSQTRITGLRAATFVGQVTADHPDFDLAADQLAIDFQRPDKDSDLKNDPTRIQATGHVVVHAQGDAADEQFAITCESLAIALGHDIDGAVYAESMRAVADVRLERPGSFLTCHRIDVAFAPPSETEPPQAPEGEADSGEGNTRDPRYAQVRQVVAVGEVRAQIHDEERGQTVNLVADHMLADIANDRLTLYATEEGELAELIDVQDDRLLRGRLIDLDDQAQIVRVEGPGALSARMEDPERPGNPQANMTIQWSHAMRFNNANGKAHFQGDVHATTRRTADTTDMTADDLEVWFTEAPAEEADGAGGEADAVVADTEEEDALDATGRNVRLAIAKGNVRFVAATRAAETPDQPNSRVTIAGPELVFTNTPVDVLGAPLPTPVETVVVNGQGYMFIEDYRPPDEADPEDADAEANPAAVAFTGRGQTAFRWTEQMELDARANTATFVGDARMDHDPTPKDRGNNDDVHMDCQQLAADMHDTGGLGVWMSDDAPAPEISVVTAEGPLSIIRAGRQITGDHLRYVAADERVEVWADENRDVLIQEVNSPAPARCGRVIWDLANNRIEMLNARGGAAPTER